ncbi:MAG: tetratricopeptide repeat protein [Akkermansiaceae bacterium]
MRLVYTFALVVSGVVNGESLLDFSYGILEEQRGNQELANDFFTKAYEADPVSMPLVQKAVSLRMNENDRSGAIAIYERVIRARPEEMVIRVEYGDFLGRVGRGDALAEKKREENYLAVLSAMPGQYLPVERLIRQAREQSNDDRARELLEQLDSTSSPEAVQYYVATTKSLYDSEDVAARNRISGVFEKAMELHPEWQVTARAASDHFREVGDVSRAIKVLQQHVESSPSSLDLRIRLGILHFVAEQNEQGVEVLKRVLAIHPKKALAHESLAKHFRKEGSTEEVRYHSAELLKIRGGSPEEFISLADEFLAAEQPREARLLLEKAVFDHPEKAKLMMKLAMATSRDPTTKDDAARLFREAENMLGNPADATPDFLLESAAELVERGQTKAAEERLRNAIRTFPKEAKKETAAALRALADIWISEGRNIDAARSLVTRAEALEK